MCYPCLDYVYQGPPESHFLFGEYLLAPASPTWSWSFLVFISTCPPNYRSTPSPRSFSCSSKAHHDTSSLAWTPFLQVCAHAVDFWWSSPWQLPGGSGTRSQQGVFPEHMTLYHLIGAAKLMEAPEEEG